VTILLIFSQLSDFYEEKDTNIRIVTPSGQDSDAI